MNLFNERTSSPPEPTADWVPPVDIVEHAGYFTVLADLPGIAPESIDVSLDGNALTLSGERWRVDPGNARPRHAERSSGRFLRRFMLPDTVDSEAIEAHTSNGVLALRIPKTPDVRPRRIDIATDG